MKTTFKVLSISLICLITLLIITTILLPRLVNTTAFKQELVKQVEIYTGKSLSLEGDLRLSVFPWLGIKTGKVSLSHESELSSQNFFESHSVDIGVKLLPLFKKQIVVDTVTLDRPVLNYIVNKMGRTSFDSLAKVNTDIQTAPPNNIVTEEDRHSYMLTELVIYGIAIFDGQLVYTNEQTNDRYEIKNLNLNTGELLSKVPSRSDFTATLKINKQKSIDINLQSTIAFDSDEKTTNITDIQLQIKNPKMTHKLSLLIDSFSFSQPKKSIIIKSIKAMAPLGKISPELSIPLIELNLEDTKSTMTPFSLVDNKSKSELLGELLIKDWNSQAIIKGRLQGHKLKPLELLSIFGVSYSPTHANSLKSFSFNTQLSASKHGFSLHNLKLELDTSTLNGSVSIMDFTNPQYRFDLTLDKIIVDHYLPIEEEISKQKNQTLTGFSILAPMPLFKNLTANGKFRAKEIKTNGAKINDFILDVKSHKNIVTIKPTAKLYEGTTTGTIIFNDKKTSSTLSFKNEFNNINIGKLLNDTQLSDQLVGNANIKLKLTITEKLGKQNNRGKVDLLINNGSIKGFDIKKILDNTQNKFDQLRGKAIANELEGNSSIDDETGFTEAAATLNILDNVINNDDLSIKSPAFRITGRGNIYLEPKNLDYLTSIAVVNTNSGQGGKNRDKLKGINIPVRFYGDITAPSYKIDTRALIKENTKNEINIKKAELKNKLSEKLGLNKGDENSSDNTGSTMDNTDEPLSEKNLKDELKDELKKKLLDGLFK